MRVRGVRGSRGREEATSNPREVVWKGVGERRVQGQSSLRPRKVTAG